MPQYSFGSGFLYGIPSGANPTPVPFGTLQDVSLSITFAVKRLMGQYQSPVAVARAGATYNGKAKAASINSAQYNNLFTGLTDAAGSAQTVTAEAFSPTATAYTAVNGANYRDDLGLVYAATGLSLTRVAAAPTVGQYTINTATGVYGFNATDNGVAMLAAYTYNASAVGRSMTYVNQLMGAAPIFTMVLNVPFQQFGTALTFKFYQCMSTKLAFDFKNEDFTIPEFDFECFANAAGQIYTANFSS